MRIKSIHIDAFGKVKDRSFDLTDGLNVFYGPNESGKSTTMEFIRCTLVPNKSNKSSYPERSKTDSGTIVYEEDGKEKRVMMEGKTGHKGDAPICVDEMDPSLYRNIFAMNREGLDEMSALSNGDIRSRFLTIPGGESMPDVIESIDGDWERTIGKTSTSPSVINALQKREDTVLQRIFELRSNADSYSELSVRREELEKRLEVIRASNKKAMDNNTLYSRVESQRPNFDSLARYKARRDELLKKPLLQEGAEKTYSDLKNEANSKKAAYKALEDTRRDQIASLPGGDENRLLRFRPRIQSVLDRQHENRSIPVHTTQPMQTPHSKVPLIVMAVLVIAAIAVWLIPGVEVFVPIGADIALAAAIAVLFIKSRGEREAPAVASIDNRLADYEREVSALSSELGIGPINIEADLRNMSEIIAKLNALDSSRDTYNNARMEFLSADNKLLGFLAQYGGEQGFMAARDNTAELRDCNSNIETLESNIRKSGLDPTLPLPAVTKMDVDMSEYAVVNREKGSIEEKMKHILDTQELDRLIDESYTISSEKGKVLREGAVSLLASMIVQDACSELYETVHPDVIATADRYLSLMTGGTCRMDIDPRNQDISVISNGEPKNSRQWSTGLRAQILLSIKLAIAKEMGNGDIPVILDDVLLPFDSERKKGALEALSLLSKEMQVLLFSCDDDVDEMSRTMSGVSIITM